jgi:hypothetical protein
MRLKPPKEIEVCLKGEVMGQTDRSALARFDYEPGEAERWNGLTGVGNPEIPASVEVTEVNIDGHWYGRIDLPPIDWDDLDQQVMDAIIELDDDDAAARDEYERTKYQERDE